MAIRSPARAGLLFAALILLWGLPPARAQEPLAPVPVVFTATLAADRVVEPVASSGHGEAIAVLTGDRLVVTGTYRDLGSPLRPGREAYVLTGAPGEEGDHIRLSAEQAILGPPRFTQLRTSGATAGHFTGVFTLTDEQVDELKRGLYHVQLYTEANPDGELRGQLESDLVFDATAEDMVGVWWDPDEMDGFQNYADGTWDYVSSLANIGQPGDSFSQWTFEDGIYTFAYGGRQQVEYTELYRDGRLRYLVLEAGISGHRPGTWHERVLLDGRGRRANLRE